MEEMDIKSEFTMMKEKSSYKHSYKHSRTDTSKKYSKLKQKIIDAKEFNETKKNSMEKNRNVVLFTGRALIEILRD